MFLIGINIKQVIASIILQHDSFKDTNLLRYRCLISHEGKNLAHFTRINAETSKDILFF